MEKKKKRSSDSFQHLTVISFFAIIALWCVITYGGLVSSLFVPSPTEVFQALMKTAKDGSLWADCLISIKRVMTGWLWSAVAALPCGMLMARSRRFKAVFQPVIEFVRYLPVVALVPLTILYLGVDETPKYVKIGRASCRERVYVSV